MFDQTTPKPAEAVSQTPASEDKRRPKNAAAYAVLWVCAVLCVVFALITLFIQG